MCHSVNKNMRAILRSDIVLAVLEDDKRLTGIHPVLHMALLFEVPWLRPDGRGAIPRRD